MDYETAMCLAAEVTGSIDKLHLELQKLVKELERLGNIVERLYMQGK